MKLIFIASPYAGDIEKNIAYAKQACRHVLNEGNAFFCPHLLYPQILNDNNPEERKLGISLGKEVLAKCDELWVFGHSITSGMFEEIQFARAKGIPVKRIKHPNLDMNINTNEQTPLRLGM